MALRLGEAWHHGPIILSWPEVLAGARHDGDGTNVVLHEFAHYLDSQDHDFNGTPPLDDREQYRTWHDVMTAEYDRLVRKAERGVPTLLDQYGATNEAEFFAVATECFFEQPVKMAERYARLYDVLRQYYRQDPASRVGRSQS
jgi:Mlc titration factor MtfA (ptsG expression regulator)